MIDFLFEILVVFVGLLPVAIIFGIAALLLFARDKWRKEYPKKIKEPRPDRPRRKSARPSDKRSKEFKPPDMTAFERPCRILKYTEHLRYTIFFVKRFLIHKQRVAGFDRGSWNLYLKNGKEYSYCDNPKDVKRKILPEGTAEINVIEDFNYSRVADEASASMSFYPVGKGDPEFYREGKTELVAHSETPLPPRRKLIVSCGGSTYDVNITSFTFLRYRAEVYETGQHIASIQNMLFWFTATFEKKLPLLDCIIMCLLIGFYTDEQATSEQAVAVTQQSPEIDRMIKGSRQPRSPFAVVRGGW